jgi:hypothetical protein
MWHTNTAMQNLLPAGYSTLARAQDVIHEKLEMYIGEGLRVIDGVLTTPWFWAHRGNASLANCHDETGLECFVNKLHIDDEFERAEWFEAIYIFGELVARRSGGYKVRIIATIDDLSCTIRFHSIREGQDWLGGDIEDHANPVMYTDCIG